MSIFPRKPMQGDNAIESVVHSVNQIIDFLPSLEIRGDDKTVRINSFGTGKTIEVISMPQNIIGGGEQQSVNSNIMVEIINKEVPIKVKKVLSDGTLEDEIFILSTGTISVLPGGLGGRIIVNETDLEVVGGSQNL